MSTALLSLQAEIIKWVFLTQCILTVQVHHKTVNVKSRFCIKSAVKWIAFWGAKSDPLAAIFMCFHRLFCAAVVYQLYSLRGNGTAVKWTQRWGQNAADPTIICIYSGLCLKHCCFWNKILKKFCFTWTAEMFLWCNYFNWAFWSSRYRQTPQALLLMLSWQAAYESSRNFWF